MPAIIDSAPDCIVHKEGYNADDVADFVVGNNYQDCAGFMTFGPGSTYGDDGVGGATAYLTLTWIGIVVMVIVFVGWVWYENHRLIDLRPDRRRPGRADRRAPAATRADIGANE